MLIYTINIEHYYYYHNDVECLSGFRKIILARKNFPILQEHNFKFSVLEI